jgi:hypothetical protein
MTMANLALACGVGVAIIVLVHRADWLRRIVEPLAGSPTTANPMPLRRLDPTCRLRGWRTLAGEVDRVCAGLRAEGVEPVLAGSGWALPGEVGFYCQGRPAVYSVGLAQGDRHSQYDLWRPNPVADPDHFRGRTFVIVGFIGPDVRAAFRQVDQPRAVIHAEDGRPVAAWQILVCRDFQGFRLPSTPTRY